MPLVSLSTFDGLITNPWCVKEHLKHGKTWHRFVQLFKSQNFCFVHLQYMHFSSCYLQDIMWPQGGNMMQELRFQVYSTVKIGVYQGNRGWLSWDLIITVKISDAGEKLYLPSRPGPLLGPMHEQRLVHLFDCNPVVLTVNDKNVRTTHSNTNDLVDF